MFHKLPLRKLELWFILRSFFLLRLLFVCINLPYDLVFNTISGLVLSVTTWICWISNRNGCRVVGPAIAVKMENVFYFTPKALLVFWGNQSLEFLIFKFKDVIKCPSINQYILLNNLGSKHSLLMKFDQFMSYYKRKNFSKKFDESCDLKTSSRPFLFAKN